MQQESLSVGFSHFMSSPLCPLCNSIVQMHRPPEMGMLLSGDRETEAITRKARADWTVVSDGLVGLSQLTARLTTRSKMGRLVISTSNALRSPALVIRDAAPISGRDLAVSSQASAARACVPPTTIPAACSRHGRRTGAPEVARAASRARWDGADNAAVEMFAGFHRFRSAVSPVPTCGLSFSWPHCPDSSSPARSRPSKGLLSHDQIEWTE